MSINLSWPTDEGTKQAEVVIPVGGIAALRKQVIKHLGNDLKNMDFVLTDTLRDITNDEDIARIQNGSTIIVAHMKDGSLAAPCKERITFQPHPKTLTMAGDYEYFAAQGRHPFVYALAEFIDNSLRATRKNSPNPRNITISILTSGSGTSRKGLICISDNGCGMTKVELNQWAIMNNSMEDRGKAPQEPDASTRGGSTGAGRFLSGDLSFFGVGSKNAAFFMGSSVKIVTRKAGELYVHELSLAAADLESRYRNNQAVYEEEMIHRNPGDDSTLSVVESGFAMPRQWVSSETQNTGEGHDRPADASGGSFTRVLVCDLKSHILDQVCDETQGQYICRELAHLYHYYLHGEHGNRHGNRNAGSGAASSAAQRLSEGGSSHGPKRKSSLSDNSNDNINSQGSDAHNNDTTAGTTTSWSAPLAHKTLPNGEPLPHIVVRRFMDTKLSWEHSLMSIDDDMETLILRGQKSELDFSMDVPGKGVISGVIYYFPYENDRETVPISSTQQSPIHGSTALGVGRLGSYSQQLPPTSRNQGPLLNHPAIPAIAGASGHANTDVETIDLVDDEHGMTNMWRVPMFEAFWQGRLIPGAQIYSLPFIDAVQQKRRGQNAKDAIPDEVFYRLRGALFFGPAFRVTRNKLLFRDDLTELLSTAIPNDRNIEKRFREWITRCHATLDKCTRFEKQCDTRTQSTIRARLGEGFTAFERITDGTKTVAVGDFVRIAAKPPLLGRVVYFTVPLVTKEEGSYPNGRVHVEQLPVQVHGKGSLCQFSLRRIEEKVDDAAAHEHCQKDIAKLPMLLHVEPMKFATGQAVTLYAGDPVPETTVTVKNGSGQTLTRSTYNGERQSLVVVQRLWMLPHEGASLLTDNEAAPEETDNEDAAAEDAVKSTKRARKPAEKKAKGKDVPVTVVPETQVDHAGSSSDGTSNAMPELIVSIENRTPYNKAPYKDSFFFSKINDGLKKAGHYAIEYVMTPAILEQPPLRCIVPITVTAAQPTSIAVSGEGVAALATQEIILGEMLPPLKIMFCDDFDNVVPFTATSEDNVDLDIRVNMPGSDDDIENMERCKGISISASQELENDSLSLCSMQVLGSKKAAANADGIPLFNRHMPETLSNADGAGVGAQRSLSQSYLQPVAARISFALKDHKLDPGIVSIRLCPGAPHALRLVPGSPWDSKDSLYSISSGEELKNFAVQAIDAWGNPTAPSPSLNFSLRISCPSLGSSSPPPATVDDSSPPCCGVFPFNGCGIATVTGLRSIPRMTGETTMVLSVECLYKKKAVQAAVNVAMPFQDLNLRLHIQPSALPAIARLIAAGEPLPTKEIPTEEGMVLTAMAGDIEAGTSLSGLRLMLLDESGVPAATQVSGKVSVSWHRGTKKITWQGESIKLPALQVPTAANETAQEWIQFQGNSANPVRVECALEIHTVPGRPAHWAVSLADARTRQQGGSVSNETGIVHCGEPFTLEIEALDRSNNRCRRTGNFPEPIIELEGDGPLDYDPETWDKGWLQDEENRQDTAVYAATVHVSGHPGQVKVNVKDAMGDGGTSALAEDSLIIDLRPGPPAALAFEGPTVLECGTRAALGNLEVSLRDAAGYPTAARENFEVVLANGALSSDGSGRAAKVVAANANKAKFAKGKTIATFKSVMVTSETEGKYVVRAQSSSRKVALQEGVLNLCMTPQVIVAGLEVLFPAETSPTDGYVAGSSCRLLVKVDADDGSGNIDDGDAGDSGPLPDDIIADALSLKVVPPGGSRSDALMLALSPNDDGRLPRDGKYYEFLLGDVTTAGIWTASAEYSEPRGDVRATLGKQAQLRSSTVSFTVQPAPPVALTVHATKVPDRITVTNAPSSKSRLLLRNTAIQLVDQHGNNAGREAVAVRFKLRPVRDESSSSDQRSKKRKSDQHVDHDQQCLPDIHISEGSDQKDADQDGRVFFGTMEIVQGSGRATSGRAMECELICEARGLYPCTQHDFEMDENGWAVVWKCAVFFSDDAAQFAAVDKLNEHRMALSERQGELTKRLQDARDAYTAAAKREKRAVQHVAAQLKRMPGDAPVTLQDAEKSLHALSKKKGQQDTDDASRGTARQARWGPTNSPFTVAIDMALRSGDEGLIGAFAQLITVSDDRLARVASAATKGLLSVLMLKDVPSRDRISTLLKSKKYPVPDIMVISHIHPFAARGGPAIANNNNNDAPAGGEDGEGHQSRRRDRHSRAHNDDNAAGDNVAYPLLGFDSACELAQSLTRSACAGTDPPLPILLPHQRIHPSGKSTVSPTMMRWPRGCLGFLCNLVRPVQRGHRASIVYNMLSNTVIFETLKDASEYRENVTQKLKMPCPVDMLSLDMGRITSRGITSGSMFNPPPIDKAEFMIGGLSESALGGVDDQIESLNALVECLKEQEAAKLSTAAAGRKMEDVETQCRGELEGVDAQLAEIDTQLGQLQSPGNKRDHGRASGAKKRRDDCHDDDCGEREEGELDNDNEEGEDRQKREGQRARRKKR